MFFEKPICSIKVWIFFFFFEKHFFGELNDPIFSRSTLKGLRFSPGDTLLQTISEKSKDSHPMTMNNINICL